MPDDGRDELVLSDEVERRDRQSSALRARNAKLDPSMTLEAWDGDAAVAYDRTIWSELTSLRFVADAHNVLLLGPVGVGKAHLAHALGGPLVIGRSADSSRRPVRCHEGRAAGVVRRSAGCQRHRRLAGADTRTVEEGRQDMAEHDVGSQLQRIVGHLELGEHGVGEDEEVQHVHE